MSLLSVREYARKYHKDAGNIRRMLASGRLNGIRIGNQWAINESTPYPADKRVRNGSYRNWRKRIGCLSEPGLFRSVNRLIERLQCIYGSHLTRVVLYGSYARKMQTEESDVDIALFLTPGHTKKMSQQMYRCVAEEELKTGKTLSVLGIDESKYNTWKDTLPFYKNIDKEGIILWTHA